MTRRRSIFQLAIGAFALLAICPPLFARTLTIDERVESQRAIEQVYWNHRTWPAANPTPKPLLSSVMSDIALRAKVEDYLKKSNALETYWQRQVTASQLQAEMDRMVRDTRDGATLGELFRALGDDPYVIAETLARQTLVERLIHNWYANDTRFHGDLKAKAEAALASCANVDCMKTMGGEYRATTWKRRTEQNVRSVAASDSAIELDADAWKDLVARFETQMGATAASVSGDHWSAISESPEAFAVTTVLAQGDSEFTTATVAWPKRTFDGWWDDARHHVGVANGPSGDRFDLPAVPLSPCTPDTWTLTLADYPDIRNSHSAVWTGTEMIVWGGTNGTYLNTGGRYNPSTDSWTPTSTGANVPEGRASHIAVWTGAQMIVWGGTNGAYLNTGGRYNPSTDSWTATSTGASAPAGRYLHTAVWTGTTMIVWGGYNGAYLNTGGRYNPSTDSWTATSTGTGVPAGRYLHTAVWTGTTMIVWGGYGGTYFNSGGQYNPSSDSWSATALGASVPTARNFHTAVWTGTQMIVWGGRDNASYFNAGGRYDPVSNNWSATSMGPNVPVGRVAHTAVWTGTQMVVWGGFGGGATSQDDTNTGGRYTPSSDSWAATSTGANVPAARERHSAVWTGTEMIVWGGQIHNANLNTGGRYDPSTDSWTATSTGSNVPAGRLSFSTIWTGTEMIVWGGGNAGLVFKTGGRYNPATDSWTATPTADAPTARDSHTAVWTGTQMIVWGGLSIGPFFNTPVGTGGRYNVFTDKWTPTSTGAGVPVGRWAHVAVWTGTEMIVWAGRDGTSYFNTGGRYDPAADRWTATSTVANVPTARAYDISAVWTGAEMIVWGGSNGASLNTGGRYDPSTDNWIPTSTVSGVPAARGSQTTVWTGAQMIVWGGYNGAYLNTGGGYDPSTDTWTATSTGINVPSQRSSASAVWTGAEMIVWGGRMGSSYYNTGGRYDPSSDAWTSTATGAGVPTGRVGHNAVWTGSQMIVWGGTTSQSVTEVGGVYCVCAGGPTAYRDADGDGYGDPANAWSPCEGPVPAGYVPDSSDCNDANSAAHPGAVEICNGVDDDCDGSIDNGGGTALCADGNVCTDDVCNGVSGCANVNNTLPCSDGNACTSGDTCGGGTCNPGAPLACDDNNVCTTDTCDPATGCAHTPSSLACDDGTVCTTGDQCIAGACVGIPISCDDGNACTTDSCDQALGCASTNNTSACNDGNACTSGDVCSGGTCHSGTVAPPPAEVEAIVVSIGAETTLTWTAASGGEVYDVASSTISDLHSHGVATAICLANDVQGTQYVDPRTELTLGDGYYYLIRAQNACGTGSFGSDSTGQERLPTSACP